MLCPISDKRKLLRTCRRFHELTPLMKQIESDFQQMINQIDFFDNITFTRFDNSLYKYTIELIYDGYYHLIPNEYVVPENRILHQYDEIYYRIGLSGNLSMIKKLLKLKKDYDYGIEIYHIMKGLAFAGHLDVLKWMYRQDYEIHPRTLHGAIKGNHIKIITWRISKGDIFPISDGTITKSCYIASKFNRVDILKLLLNMKDCHYDDDAMCYATYNGHFEIVKLLHSKRECAITKIKKSDMCSYAISGGHLNILEWAIKHKYPMKYIDTNVEDKNNSHILEWMRNTEPAKYNKWICRLAVSIGDIQTLEWYASNTLLYGTSLTTFAVRKNKIEFEFESKKYAQRIQNYSATIECIKWLIMNGCHLTDDTYRVIVMMGNLEFLKWLTQYNYRDIDIDRSTCEVVIATGNMDLLQWIVSNGTKLCHYMYDVAIRSDVPLHILQQLATSDYFNDNKKSKLRNIICEMAIDNCNLPLLQWAINNNYPCNKNICNETICYSDLDTLKWLRKNGYDWDENFCIQAIEHDRFDMLKWAIENGCLWGKKRAYVLIFVEMKKL